MYIDQDIVNHIVQDFQTTEKDVFWYFVRHGFVEEEGSMDKLVRNLYASPELCYLNENDIEEACADLIERKILSPKSWRISTVTEIEDSEYKSTRIDHREGWFLNINDIQLLTQNEDHLSRISASIQEIERDFINAPDLVVHDGMAKYKGFDSLERDISRIRPGSLVRWITFHGLTEKFTDLIKNHAKTTYFKMRILVIDENAHTDLFEGALPHAVKKRLDLGIIRLRGLRDELRIINPNCKIRIRRYGLFRPDGFFRGMLITNANDDIESLSLITMPWPKGAGPVGRGTEGVRLLCSTTGQGVSTLAHLFKWYFDDIWRRSNLIWRSLVPIWFVLTFASLALLISTSFNDSIRTWSTLIGVASGTLVTLGASYWTIRRKLREDS